MSLFRHSVWFSFSVKQFPSADFGICNICSSVQADFYWFSLYSFHNFSLRFILKIFLKFRKFKLPYSYKALRVYLLPIDLTFAAFPTHGPDRWIRQQSRNVPPRSPNIIKVSRLKIPQWPLRMRTSQRELSVALPFRVYGEWVFQLICFPKNVLLSRDERNPFFFVFSSSSFFFFCESDDRQLYCQHIRDTTPYSCGRRKFSLACSHAQRPLRNLQSLLLRLIQPVPLQNNDMLSETVS